jgi:hypothetical protein
MFSSVSYTVTRGSRALTPQKLMNPAKNVCYYVLSSTNNLITVKPILAFVLQKGFRANAVSPFHVPYGSTKWGRNEPPQNNLHFHTIISIP